MAQKEAETLIRIATFVALLTCVRRICAYCIIILVRGSTLDTLSLYHDVYATIFSPRAQLALLTGLAI